MINNSKKIIILIGLSFLPLSLCYAESCVEKKLSPTPFLGIETGYTNHSYNSEYGKGIFVKTQPKVNFFVGLKLNDFFNLEAGLEKTIKKSKDYSLNSNEKYLGTSVSNLFEKINNSSSTKFIGKYFGITSNLRLNDNFSLLGGIALKRERVSLRNTIKSQAWSHGVTEKVNNHTSLTDTKTLVRLTGGIQYTLSEHVSARAIINWENSSRLTPKGVGRNGAPIEARLKNAVGCSIGLVFNY